MFLMKNKAGHIFIQASTESMKRELENKGFIEVKPEKKTPEVKKNQKSK